MTEKLSTRPYPVNVSWKRWRDPADADTTRPVVVLTKGRSTILVGPDDAPNIIDALERVQAAWEDEQA